MRIPPRRTIGRRGRARTGLAAAAGGLAAAAGLGALAVRSGPTARASQSALLAALSPRQLAGERIILSYKGRTPPPELLRLVRTGAAAGVIFFHDNIASASQLRGVIDELQAAARRSPVRLPLLTLTDQEGGRVRRLPGAPVASEQAIGAAADPLAAARAAGRSASLNLAGAGINVNLAPVLDVYRDPRAFIALEGRSYSDDPRAVARLGSAFLAAQQAGGVAATAKHFPGLGAAGRSTDTAPVTLPLPLAALRARDEPPYAAAIAAGVKLVMVSWAVYPALDPARPAGLSPVVVGGELRRRLHFTGVTVSDALEAGALRGYGGPGRRAVRAAQAGMDLILCSSGHLSQGRAAAAALAVGLERRALDRVAFSRAVARVLVLRAESRLGGYGTRSAGR